MSNFDVLDFTDSIKLVCQALSTLALSEGVPKVIYEGLLNVPKIDSTSDLPIVIVDTIDEMSFLSANVPVQKVELIAPLNIWYVRNNPVDVYPADTLRADGELIASTFWNSNLTKTVERVNIKNINWSNYNFLNSVFIEEDINLIAVSVGIELQRLVSRDL